MEISSFLNSLLAGIIQGITESFPVSSSGHLLLFSNITNLKLEIAEIAVLHLGTFIAIVIGMWDKIKEIKDFKILRNIIIATIPGGIVGYFFEDWIDKQLSMPWIIAMSLIFWGFILVIIDYWSSKKQFTVKRLNKVTPIQSLIVGLGQILAFVPGTSRSGITTIAGIMSGIQPSAAIEFGFLAGIILIPSSGILSVIKGIDTNIEPIYIILATITSAIIGVISIKILRRYINQKILTVCGYYRIILGLLVLFLS